MFLKIKLRLNIVFASFLESHLNYYKSFLLINQSYKSYYKIYKNNNNY